MPDKRSKEDSDILQRAEMLRGLIESDGWKVAKEIIDEQIRVVQLVQNIDYEQPIDAIGKEAYARAAAISLVTDWFQLIYAEVEHFNEQLIQDEEEPYIIDKSA